MFLHFGLFALSAFAAEAPQLNLVGLDRATKAPCTLSVYEFGREKPFDVVRARVSTSYLHEDEQDEPVVGHTETFALSKVDGQPNQFGGKSDDGDQEITVYLKTSDRNLRNATSFSQKANHGSHVHVHKCEQLKIK